MKKLISAITRFVIATLPIAGNAQAPDTLWTRMYGGAFNDLGSEIVTTADGGYAIGAYTDSHTGGQNTDFWLLKIDADGNELWNHTYGGEFGDYCRTIDVTSDGGFILAGESRSFGEDGEHYMLVKTDSLGNEQWTRDFFHGSDPIWVSHNCSYVEQTTDGGYFLGGHSWRISEGTQQFWVVKTDSNGIEEWNREYGGQNEEVLASAQQTGDGGFILGGSLGTESGWHFLLIKIDSQGNLQWNRNYPPAFSECADVRQTSDGGYTLAGTHTDNGGLISVHVKKTDINGILAWNYTGTTYGAGRSVIEACDGSFLIAAAGPNNNRIIIKLDAAGNELWVRNFGGNGDALDIELTEDRGYIVAGYLSTQGGYQDAYVLKTEPEPSRTQCFEVESVATDSFSHYRVGRDTTIKATITPPSLDAEVVFTYSYDEFVTHTELVMTPTATEGEYEVPVPSSALNGELLWFRVFAYAAIDPLHPVYTSEYRVYPYWQLRIGSDDFGLENTWCFTDTREQFWNFEYTTDYFSYTDGCVCSGQDILSRARDVCMPYWDLFTWAFGGPARTEIQAPWGVRRREAANSFFASIRDCWRSSNFGFAVYAAQRFTGVAPGGPTWDDCTHMPNGNNVHADRDLINHRHLWQFAQPYKHILKYNSDDNPLQTVNAIKDALLLENHASALILLINNEGVARDPKRLAVLPYRLERTGPQFYEIYAYHPYTATGLGDHCDSYEDPLIRVNVWESEWTTVCEGFAFSGLHSPGQFYVPAPASLISETPDIPGGMPWNYSPPPERTEGEITMYTGPDSYLIVDSIGQVSGFVDSLLDAIPNAIPLLGNGEDSGAPYAWELPDDSYELYSEESLAQEARFSAWTTNGLFTMVRLANTSSGDTIEDHFSYSPFDFAVEAHGTSGLEKSVRLEQFLPDTSGERVLGVLVSGLDGNERVRLQRVNGDEFYLDNFGGNVACVIDIKQILNDSLGDFIGGPIGVGPQTRLVIAPPWNGTIEDSIAVQIDEDMNGSVDDIVVIQNLISSFPVPQDLVTQKTGNHIRLDWNHSPIPDVYYEVYSDSTSEGAFANLIGTTADAMFVDSNAVATPELKKFYAVKAVRQ